MKVETGSLVRMEYELRVKGGDVIESSSKSGPIEYVHGTGKMLPGLEKKLEGARAGVELKGVIAAADVFGSEDAFPTTEVSRDQFPKDQKIAIGSTFEAKSASGDPIALKIVNLADKTATVRLMPVIAGKDLEFRAKILMIEDPKTHQREVVQRAPPPPPAAALKVDVEDSE